MDSGGSSSRIWTLPEACSHDHHGIQKWQPRDKPTRGQFPPEDITHKGSKPPTREFPAQTSEPKNPTFLQIVVGVLGPQQQAPDPSGHSGPQQQAPDRSGHSRASTAALDHSGHSRTSTASSISQWALPDRNTKLQIAVGTLYQAANRSGHSRTSITQSTTGPKPQHRTWAPQQHQL